MQFLVPCFVFFRASTSPGKDPECCGKCSASDVSKVSAVLLAVSAESGELYLTVCSLYVFKKDSVPSEMAHSCRAGLELMSQVT